MASNARNDQLDRRLLTKKFWVSYFWIHMRNVLLGDGVKMEHYYYGHDIIQWITNDGNFFKK